MVKKNRVLSRRQVYTEELANVLSHGIGILFGLFALCLLLYKAIGTNDPWVIGSFTVYALCMTFSYVTSTFYHASTNARQKRILRRFDHAAIYFHIAGTYTPFALVALRNEGYWGWGLFFVVWVSAAIGTWLSFRKMKKNNHLKTVCYLLMGWVVVIALKPLIDVFQRTDQLIVLYWLIAGGVFYSLGTFFFFLDKHRFMHCIWHLFVLGGSVCHVMAVYRLV